MTIIKTYDAIIKHSLNNSNVPVIDHLIEEMSELIQELCKEKRHRDFNTLEEMADVLFQMDKYLKISGFNIDYLRGLSIAKSCKKYPKFMESLN